MDKTARLNKCGMWRWEDVTAGPGLTITYHVLMLSLYLTETQFSHV